MPKPRIVWADFSPFDVACWDGEKVVLDRKLRGSKFLAHIISHEMAHSKSKAPIDIHIELMDRKPKGFFLDMMRRKPLSVLNAFVPVIFYRLGRSLVWGVDYSRVLIMAIYVAYVLVCLKVFGIF